MIRFFILSLCFICYSLSGKDAPKYPVSAIPEQLKKNVNVVFREDVMEYKILSKSKATEYVRQVITIFNSNGKHYAKEQIGYDKLSKINLIKAAVYDANGVLIKKLKTSDIYDHSAFDGYSLYSDSRIKGFDLIQGSYPYTVEIEYEVEYKFLFHLPVWTIVPNEKVSVEFSSLTITYPKDLKPRYSKINVSEEPVVKNVDNNIESMSWSYKNVMPIQFEPFGSPYDALQQIYLSPSLFEYDSYNGKMDSWDNFGKWVASLNKNRNNLPVQTKEKIIALTANLSTTEEKTKAVYEYMQNKTRYVSISLGIGGWQPFQADVVDQVGYGDCKALSNYMVSMLDVIGIKSHYVLIYSGETYRTLNTQFPSPQFNHAIVCVPNGQDTVWLECTSQTNPFGYMGKHTGGRKALAITPEGASIVSTPEYITEHNVQSRNATVIMDGKGDGKAKIKTTYSGLQYENENLNWVLNNQYDKQEKWIRSNTSIPSFDLIDFKMTNIKAKIPSAILDLNLNLNRLATVNGKRLFLTPNLMNRSSFVPEKVESRKTDVVLRMSFADYDTITYKIPEELYTEFLPEPFQIQSQFGEYEASFKLDQGTVIYTRKLIMRKGKYAPESYPELINFYKQVNKADHVKLVFLNKT